MELYIIRHAQSTNNALTDRADRGCDPPLTALGRGQAEYLAQHLTTEMQRLSPRERGYLERGYGITHLYCSPMWRALQTAQPIGEALGLTPKVWIDIHEWGGIFLDHGEPEGVVGHPGKTRPEILEEFPNYVLPEGIREEGWWAMATEEDRAGAMARAIRVVETLQRRAGDKDDEQIVIVTHAGFGAMLIKAFLNLLPSDDVWFHIRNTSISRIELRTGEPLHVCYLNRVDHLPPEMVT
jgi:broad specificity phosphatase PhoE